MIGTLEIPQPMTPAVANAETFFFFNDTATTEIYTLSLHDALPIYPRHSRGWVRGRRAQCGPQTHPGGSLAQSDSGPDDGFRSEEHTSELQSQSNLVCRLLLENNNSIRAASIRPQVRTTMWQLGSFG